MPDNVTGNVTSDVTGDVTAGTSLIVGARSPAESVLIFVFFLATTLANLLIILIHFRSHGLKCINRYFLCSLTLSDLGIGFLVSPLAFAASLYDSWVFGTAMCHIVAYTLSMLLLASLYSMMLIGLDHYVAIRKPDRYSAILSPVRCMCWIIFCWIVAVSFCCPPMFGILRASYFPLGYVCLIDWRKQRAYFITSLITAVVPAVLGILFANGFLFTKKYQIKKDIYEKCGSSAFDDSRPRYYYVNFIISLTFLLAWLPWCVLELDFISHPTRRYSRHLHFISLWLGLGNSLWKFCIYAAMCSDFRCGLRSMFTRTRVQCTCRKQ